jgi:hypothetical protein
MSGSCFIIFIGTPPPFVAKVKDVGDGFSGYMSLDDDPLLQYGNPLGDDFQNWIIRTTKLHRQLLTQKKINWWRCFECDEIQKDKKYCEDNMGNACCEDCRKGLNEDDYHF